MENFDRFKLGLFVMAGFGLLLMTLFALGFRDHFKEYLYLSTRFTESVQGLDKGAAVKFRGVPIGTVSDISILSDRQIQVIMRIETDNIENEDSGFSMTNRLKEVEERLSSYIPEGLRCQLNAAGITGIKYIEFDFFPSAPAITEDTPTHVADCAFIPSTPSLLTDTVRVFQKSLENFSKMDLEGISNRIKKVLDNVDALTGEEQFDAIVGDAQHLISDARTTLKTFRQLAESVPVKEISQDLAKALSQFDQTLSELESLGKSVNSKISGLDINGVSTQLNDSMVELQKTAKVYRRLPTDLTKSFQQIQEAIDQLTNLTDSIQEDPASLIYGRRQSGDQLPSNAN